MGFRDALKSGRTVITTDVIPPKGTDLSKRLASLQEISGRVDGINITDMPSANLRMSALAMSVKVRELGFDPILQITCRDRNRLSLQAELLGAHVLGVSNLLLLSGDDVDKSDHPGVKSVFDLGSVTLIEAARGLEKGHDLGGNAIKGAPDFCVGAALDPDKEPQGAEIDKAWDKIKAGTEFFQTQPIFDVASFASFLEKMGKTEVPIIAGVFLITSAKMARFFNDNVPGVTIPDNIVREFDESADPLKTGVEVTARLARELKEMCAGIHIMMVSDLHNLIPDILKQSRLV